MTEERKKAIFVTNHFPGWSKTRTDCITTEERLEDEIVFLIHLERGEFPEFNRPNQPSFTISVYTL